MSNNKGPGLYEFLTEAELQQYFNVLKKDLKVQNVGQLKFVTEEDLAKIGMSKPEIRRLKKFYQKYFPQRYISKLMKGIRTKKDGLDPIEIVMPEGIGGKAPVKVPSKYIIPAESIVKNKQLGIGEFGVVQQGVWTNEDGERVQVAIKCLSKDKVQNSMEFLKEAAIMHTIDSEHIVRLYGVVLESSSLMLVTELAPLRSLLECLKETNLRNSFTVKTLCDYSIQICDGMTYLENKRLIHRDLAARNILVFTKSQVKISDFGLSRALGVGKDYYQTNFNVNLKLPIAWCAPECINYLRFTSASDVWAFGVTLWEMFSYGFQPWAALTGQQILEAIDEPNYQRLEQPDACPKDYYSIMLQCWHAEPHKRLKFVDLINVLVDSKPEQVKMVREDNDGVQPKLPYVIGDVITVLDKRPLEDNPTIWKGVLNNGRTGLFNAANTIAYLGTNVPSAKSVFSRGDGKNAYSSRRRLCSEMISVPQGDLKHTGHIGINGIHWGDLTFMGEEVPSTNPIKLDNHKALPKQIVTPYKPSEDHITLTRASSDVSDKAPLLKKVGEKGKFGPASDVDEEDDCCVINNKNDHEYHEISDEDDPKKDANGLGNFDLGPSLLDEVFKALGTNTTSSTALLENGDKSGEKPSDFKNTFSKDTMKRKQAMVKPISAHDEKTLDNAIAIAHHLAAKSISNMGKDEISGDDSALTNTPPASPEKSLKFPFKLAKHSPKPERRLFSVEANSIPDLQYMDEDAEESSITAEAQEVYNSLVGRSSPQCDSLDALGPPDAENNNDAHNPLRMLRKGMTVKPKVRGNKHNFTNGDRNSLVRASTRETMTAGFDPATHQTLPRGFKHNKIPPPVKPKPRLHKDESHCGSSNEIDDSKNPLPLPPRDPKCREPQTKSRHQRKHPLLTPNALLRASGLSSALSSDKTDSSPRLLIQHTHNPLLESQGSATECKESSDAKLPPEKPPRLYQSTEPLDNSFDSQVAFEMDALDQIFDDPVLAGLTTTEGLLIPKETTDKNYFDKNLLSSNRLYNRRDHVSCEDLLDFAMDKPNSKRTQGPAHGARSDEVHLIRKVLKNQVTEDQCLEALNECEWDVHRALKIFQLSPTLNLLNLSYKTAKQTLQSFSWDVDKSRAYLQAKSGVDEDTAQV